MLEDRGPTSTARVCAEAVWPSGKNTRISMRNSGINTAADHPKWARKEGISRPLRSAMAFTMNVDIARGG